MYSTLIILSVSALYVIIPMMTGYETINPTILKFLYVIVLLIGQFVLNMVTSFGCRSTGMASTLMIVTIGSILLYVSTYLILTVFPGWLSPFSNTFGYAVARLSGLDGLLAELFKNPDDVKGNKELSDIMVRLTTEPTLIFNNLTPDNIETFIKNMGDTLSYNNQSGNLDRLRRFVYMKYNISFAVWFILLSVVSFSIGRNYILSQDCRKKKKSTTPED